MEEIVMQIIAEIQAEKKRGNEKPEHVLFCRELLPEVRKRIEKSLDILVKGGKVNRYNTINDTAYGYD